MRLKKYFIYVFLLLFTTTGWTNVSSNSETQELSYDDLLLELKAHKSHVQKEIYHPYDDLLIHTSLGFVSSFSTVNAANKSSFWQQSGLELAIGVDLFSKQWYTEGSFKNYGVTNQGRTELSLRQLDFKIGYKDQIKDRWNYHAGAGLSTRSLKYTDPIARLTLDETSPAFLIFGGSSIQASPLVSCGIELGARSPFVNSNLDRGSFELGLLLGISI